MAYFKSHGHFPLPWSFYRISVSPMSRVTSRNNLSFFSTLDLGTTPCRLSAIDIHSYYPCMETVFSIRNPMTIHAVVRGANIIWNLQA